MVRSAAKSNVKAKEKSSSTSLAEEVTRALTWLEAHASTRTRNEMGPRYGVHTNTAYGVSMADMQRLAKELGVNHQLAIALWETGWYEARMVASMVDDPALVTVAQMQRWCKEFDNWGICDTVCFKLFDRVPHAWKMIDRWCTRRGEFEKRGGFALLASVALHDKSAANALFVARLPLVEQGARDDRNFVRKSVSWALRAIGGRNVVLRNAATTLAQQLASSSDGAERWVGKDALKGLTSAATAKRAARS